MRKSFNRTAGRGFPARCARWTAVAAGAGIASYAAWIGVSWWRYGLVEPSIGPDSDALLDRYMPGYDIVERHRTYVRAPAAMVLAAASEIDLQRVPLARAIFKGRELLLGGKPDDATRPREFLALTQSLGWGALAEVPGREIVMGAVTRPWEADVVFRAVPAAEFADFHEPGYVKIAWTLRADPVGDAESIFKTETRAVATDGDARARFRRYWAFMSPGITLIRRATLGPVRREAQRRAREAGLGRSVATARG